MSYNRRFDDTTWDAPCMERNLATLLCFSTEHAVEVANLCAQHETTKDGRHITDKNLAKIIQCALGYVRTFNRPPELHIFSLFQHEWQNNGDTQLENDLTEMLAFSEHVHTEWVLKEFHSYARQQWRNERLEKALRLTMTSLSPEDEAKADEMLNRQSVVANCYQAQGAHSQWRRPSNYGRQSCQSGANLSLGSSKRV